MSKDWPSAREDDVQLGKRGYTVGQKVGEGSYAKVRSAQSKTLGKQVAIKIIDLAKAPEDFRAKFFPRELQILKDVNHANIVKLHESFKIGTKTYLVMELAGHGDLLEYVKLHGYLTEARSKAFFRQMCEAVKYLHSRCIIHRDLKCENILLDIANNVKISDFGFARYLLPGEESKTFCGSAAYAAPEILRGDPYKGFAYDIWSLGVILYIMVCGKMPFDDSNLDHLQKAQRDKKIRYPQALVKKISDEAKSLVAQMLEPNLDERINMEAILTSEWLKNTPYVFNPLPVSDKQSGTFSNDNTKESASTKTMPAEEPQPPPKRDSKKKKSKSGESEKDKKRDRKHSKVEGDEMTKPLSMIRRWMGANKSVKGKNNKRQSNA